MSLPGGPVRVARPALAQRTVGFTESVIREMTRLNAQHGGINLAQGFPDFPAPAEIKEAAKRAIDADVNQYAITWGAPSLRRAIAASYRELYAMDVDPETMLTVTCGATEAMISTLLAVVDPGDEVVVLEPFYENYGPDTAICGAVPVYVPLRPPENGFDPDELRRAFSARTKAIIVNSPHNPTGAVLSSTAVREIARIARERDLWVLSDEIYGETLYDGEHRSLLAEDAMDERTILLDGFSKTYAMTGWRLGFGVFPRPLVDPVTKLVTNSVSCTATFVQRAGVAALSSRPPEVDAMVRAFRERRDAIVAGLNAVPGVTCLLPKGAFYVFPNITGLGLGNSAQVADRFLYEAGVAVLAGTAFGRAGEGYLRLSYANSLANIQLALGRIAEWATGVVAPAAR